MNHATHGYLVWQCIALNQCELIKKEKWNYSSKIILEEQIKKEKWNYSEPVLLSFSSGNPYSGTAWQNPLPQVIWTARGSHRSWGRPAEQSGIFQIQYGPRKACCHTTECKWSHLYSTYLPHCCTTGAVPQVPHSRHFLLCHSTFHLTQNKWKIYKLFDNIFSLCVQS